jgi:hypothetical protein
MVKGADLGRNEVIRLVTLGALVILEGLAVVSVLLNLVFVPVGQFYPNIASASILVLPVIIGAFSKRVEVAVVLTVLPWFILALVYTARYAPVWNVDMYYLGTLAGRTAGAAFLLGGFGAFGWMLRRILLREAKAAE